MSQTTTPKTIYADEIVVGNRIIPAGRKRPVTIEYQLESDGHYFEFFGSTSQGTCVLRFHRSEKVQMLPAGRAA